MSPHHCTGGGTGETEASRLLAREEEDVHDDLLFDLKKRDAKAEAEKMGGGCVVARKGLSLPWGVLDGLGERMEELVASWIERSGRKLVKNL